MRTCGAGAVGLAVVAAPLAVGPAVFPDSAPPAAGPLAAALATLPPLARTTLFKCFCNAPGSTCAPRFLTSTELTARSAQNSRTALVNV